MILKPGTFLGPYEVLSLIGAGGMGEVYKGRDPRLDRLVALKVLAPHLVGNPEARERFDREAHTVGNLKHSHICVLYDIGKDGGRDFLVLEYLEGETLAERLKKGPLPLDQVLRYAIEISDALDKAHRAGITHRDIKPGNIMLVPQREKGSKIETKLLDFGLAKLKQDAALAKLPRSEWPTGMGAPTVLGTVLGTPHYMAPEQAEGKVDALDARTDIFAFGAVIHEMATGKKAFDGPSQASVMAAVLKEDPPPISSIEPPGKLSPPALDHLVKTCLAKDPEERWQTAHDITKQLQWIAESGAQAGAVSAAAFTRPGLLRRWALAAGLACLVVAAIAGVAVWTLKPSPPQPVSRFTITLPPEQRLAGLEQPTIALSPDGSHLVYAAVAGGTRQLYLRALDSLEARSIPNTEGAVNPFFSPDGQWVGFFAGGKLKKVSVSGGAAVTLADAAIPRGASWGSQGILVFPPNTVSALKQVSDAGGAPQPLTPLETGEVTQRWPEFLPGGKAVLFAASASLGNWANARVVVYSVETGERHDLVQGGTHPRYAPSGHLVYAQAGNLMAVPFDPQRLEVAGAAVPMVEGVLQSPSSGDAQYSFSATGSLVYVPGGIQAAQRRMVWVSRNGVEEALAAPARAYRYPRVSPDGGRVSVMIEEEETQLWLFDPGRGTLTRLTFEGITNAFQAWTPDGKRIAFQSNRAGTPNLYWQLADGSGGLERLTTSEYTPAPNSFSPDGQLLAFIETNPTTGFDIWVLRLSDPSASSGQARKAQPFLRTPFVESAPRFSPDGRWLAYSSDESGRSEIYVQPYPGPGGKWLISTEGGTEPVWNPNGRELFYRSGDKMMAVDVEGGQASTPVSSGQAGRPVPTGFSAGRPRILFETGQYLPTPATFPNYDVSPDGQRFLMLKPNEQQAQAATQINVVLNWFEELKRRVPAR